MASANATPARDGSHVADVTLIASPDEARALRRVLLTSYSSAAERVQKIAMSAWDGQHDETEELLGARDVLATWDRCLEIVGWSHEDNGGSPIELQLPGDLAHRVLWEGFGETVETLNDTWSGASLRELGSAVETLSYFLSRMEAAGAHQRAVKGA
jgi:hypothetical protein